MTYKSAGFLVKNKDPVSEDLMVLLQGSDAYCRLRLFGFGHGCCFLQPATGLRGHALPELEVSVCGPAGLELKLTNAIEHRLTTHNSPHGAKEPTDCLLKQLYPTLQRAVTVA